MLLGARETVVRSAYAVLEFPPRDDRRRRPGVLYLTTERLLFEAPASSGIVRDLVRGRETDLVVEEPLARLRNVTVREGRWGHSRLIVDGSGPRLAFDVLEPHEWRVAVGDVRRAAELARETPAAPAHGLGRTVVKVRCRYCGGLGDESADRCPSCGAPF